MSCPRCGGAMEAGLLLDRVGVGDVARDLLWAPAATEDDPRRIEVDAQRCTGCGYLELYAGLGDG